jgi:hypothetical protein
MDRGVAGPGGSVEFRFDLRRRVEVGAQFGGLLFVDVVEVLQFLLVAGFCFGVVHCRDRITGGAVPGSHARSLPLRPVAVTTARSPA